MKSPSKTLLNICDIGRAGRTLLPEVVYARGKSDKALADACSKLLKGDGRALVTKCTPAQISLLRKRFGQSLRCGDRSCGIAVLSKNARWKTGKHTAAVISAGASDYFVAEEAALALEFLGFAVTRHYDCGVAGIHRLVEPLETLERLRADAVIVVAGMEGALPSIVSGLVKQPVIAVPTSVGYGTSFDGVTALLSMLNTCSPGICVVNIDNGLGAAAVAAKMVSWLKRKGRE